MLDLRLFSFSDQNSKARDQWLAQILGDIPAGLTVLDVGAGQQRNKQFCRHLKYISQDFCQFEGSDQGAVGLVTESWDTSSIDIVSDITNIPLDKGSIDVVLCTEVFEHIPDPVMAMKEILRILKPGGHLLVTAPASSFAHMTPYFFYSGFSRFWYQHHLSTSCTNLEILRLGSPASFVAQELIRIPSLLPLSTELKLIFKMLLYPIIFLLRTSERYITDADSLCFGYCVSAKKKKSFS